MFFDEVILDLEGGRGGSGMLSFHREKYIDEGFPDGGDGGNGGNLILLADENYNTLQHFAGKKHYRASPGVDGHKNNRAGANGADMILKVPVGTIVYDLETGNQVADLNEKAMSYDIARGGRGGYGNGHFASSTRQAPKFAELGDIGEFKKVKLELRMVADVGLLGFPSVGKSTLISHLSDARPKVADYPFTTLVPNLGVVNLKKFGGNDNQTFVIADMPGIIEGASEGKGLGDKFLKHISRTGNLIYLLDPFSYENKTIVEQYIILKNELEKYDKNLSKKDIFICINKIDAIPEEDRKELKSVFLKKFPKLKLKLKFISAVSGEGLDKFVFDVWKSLHKKKNVKDKVENFVDPTVLKYNPVSNIDEMSFQTKKMYKLNLAGFQQHVAGMIIPVEVLPERTIYSVTGKRIQQIVRMTNLTQKDAVDRVYDVLLKMGIYNALKKSGAKNGDIIKIEPHFFEFHETR